MKLFIKLFIGLLLLVITGALAIPFLIPVESYKAEITKRVKDATGRDLVIAGDIKAQGFPSFGLRLEKVTLSNPKGYASANMLEVGALDVQVELLPLLSKQLEVKRLILNTPVVNLEINGKGVPNWIFTPPPSAETLPALQSKLWGQEAPMPPASRLALLGLQSQGRLEGTFSLVSSAHAETTSPSALENLKLGQVTIKDGTLVFANAPAKQKYTLDALQLETSLPSITAPLGVKGSARFNGEALTLDATLSTLKTLLDGHDSSLKLALASAPLNVNFDGKVSMEKVAGPLVFSTPSIPKLAAWAGSPMEWKGATPLAFSAKGALSCTLSQCALKQSAFMLDAITLNGEVGANWAAGVPFIAADVQADALDVTPYMATSNPAPAPKTSWLISSAYAQNASGWSTERIDFTGLRAVNADVSLRAKSLTLPQVKLEDLTASAKLKGGALTLNIPTVKLYGGTGTINALVDGSAPTGAISSKIKLTGVNTETLLRDFADFERFSGTADFTTRINTRGENQQQFISNLGGDGTLMVRDGAIKGINIAQIVKDAKAVFTGAAASTEKTDFAELGGTYTITGGVLTNKDFAMKAPLIRLKGEGDVNLAQQFVKYRLTPEVVNTLQGQGGADKTGLGVPIIVEGPFANLSFRPDLAAAAQDALKDPAKAKEAVRAVKEQVKENKEQIKQGIKDLKDIKNNPEAVGDLLKGFR